MADPIILGEFEIFDPGIYRETVGNDGDAGAISRASIVRTSPQIVWCVKDIITKEFGLLAPSVNGDANQSSNQASVPALAATRYVIMIKHS